MSTIKKARAVKSTEEQWRGIFDEWSTSGLSDVEFCKRENYSLDAFRYWRRRSDAPPRPSERPKRSKFQVRSDAAKQRWLRDDKKEAFWRRHIQNWQKSGLSKRAYCKSKNISESSFNAWCREIELRDREKVSSGNTSTLLADAERLAPNPFVPLRLVASEPKPEQQPDNNPSKTENASQSISILVPGGAVIRVDHCSVGFISDLYSSLKCEVAP